MGRGGTVVVSGTDGGSHDGNATPVVVVVKGAGTAGSCDPNRETTITAQTRTISTTAPQWGRLNGASYPLGARPCSNVLSWLLLGRLPDYASGASRPGGPGASCLRRGACCMAHNRRTGPPCAIRGRGGRLRGLEPTRGRLRVSAFLVSREWKARCSCQLETLNHPWEVLPVWPHVGVTVTVLLTIGLEVVGQP